MSIFEENFGTPEKLASVIDKVTFICSCKEYRQDGTKCKRWCPLMEICGGTEDEILDYLKSERKNL